MSGTSKYIEKTLNLMQPKHGSITETVTLKIERNIFATGRYTLKTKF